MKHLCRPLAAARRFLLACAGAALATHGAGAATLFADDFEAYTAGSNVVAQGGWTGALGPFLVNDSSFLQSRVLDGMTVGHLGNSYGSALHAFATPNERYRMSFDAFAPVGSFNTWGGLSSLSEGSGVYTDTGVFWLLDRGWTLRIRDARAIVFDNPTPLLPINTAVHLAITVDPLSREVFGSYDFGGGWIDTPSFVVSQHVVDALDGVNLAIDYRRPVPGLQIDNVLVATVSAVPEGGTRGLLLAGAAVLATLLRRRSSVAAIVLGVLALPTHATTSFEGWMTSSNGDVFAILAPTPGPVDVPDGGCSANQCAFGRIDGGGGLQHLNLSEQAGYASAPATVQGTVVQHGLLRVVATTAAAPSFVDMTLDLWLDGSFSGGNAGGNAVATVGVGFATQGLVGGGGSGVFRNSQAWNTPAPPPVLEGFTRIGDHVLRGTLLHVAVGQWFDFGTTLSGQVGTTGEARAAVDFRLSPVATGPVAVLPAGLTLESADWSIVANHWCAGVCAPVPEPPAALLALLGLGLLAARPRRLVRAAACRRGPPPAR